MSLKQNALKDVYFSGKFGQLELRNLMAQFMGIFVLEVHSCTLDLWLLAEFLELDQMLSWMLDDSSSSYSSGSGEPGVGSVRWKTRPSS